MCEVCKKALATYKQTIEKTVQVEAFDLCDAGVSTDHLGFLKKTRIIATPHGIDEWMVCTKEILPLDKPDQKKFTFGRPPEKLTKQQKKIQEQALEIQKYEEKVHHLADQNIQIDLDDGVKHNYELFADVLAKIK